MKTTTPIAWALTLALLTVSAPARAQAPGVAEGQARVNAASRAFSRGDYEAALRELRAAEAIAVEVDQQALPKIRFNIARCLEELGRYEEAIQAYESYNRTPDVSSRRKDRAFQALKELRREIFGTLAVACDPSGSVLEIKGVTDGVPSCPWRSEAVPPGTYALKVTHPGYLEEVRLVEVESGKSQSVQVSLQRDPNAASVVGAAAPAPFRLRAGPSIVSAVGVAALAAGIGFSVSAANNADAAEDLSNFPQRNELSDAFERDRALAITSYAIGGAGLVTGIVWFIAGGQKKDTLATRRVLPTPNGLAVRF